MAWRVYFCSFCACANAFIHCPSPRPVETFYYLSNWLSYSLCCFWHTHSAAYIHNRPMLQCPIEDLFRFINHAIIQYSFLLHIIIHHRIIGHDNGIWFAYLFVDAKRQKCRKSFPFFSSKIFRMRFNQIYDPQVIWIMLKMIGELKHGDSLN